jgi:hypothetical protein
MPSRAAATWLSAWVSTPPVTAAVFTMDMVIPFVVEGWHAPAGRQSCEPWPLAQARQDRERHRRWVPQTWDPGRQVESKDNQRRQPNSRSGRDPGHRPYARIRPNPQKQGRNHQSPSSLPNRNVYWFNRHYWFLPHVSAVRAHSSRPLGLA